MAESEDKSEEKVGGKRRAEPEKNGDKKAAAISSVHTARGYAATAVWVLAVLAAVILAIGALVIVLDFNDKNGVVSFFRDAADNINFLGELKSFDAGKSDSSQHSALVKTVLVNWGICALVYLLVGKLLERLIRP